MTAYLDLTTNAVALPTIVAAQTLGALRSNMALLGLVNRDYSNEVASYGQTVNVVVRGALTVHDKAENTDVTVQAPTATHKPVTLNKYKDVTFGEEDIATMIQRPNMIAGYAEDAAIAILEQVEADIAALYSGFSQSIDALVGLDEADFREAQRLLNSAKVPLAGRWAVLHEDGMYEAQGIERITNRDYAESLGRVQGDAYRGNAFGFNIFLDQNIATSGGEIKNMFGHPNAITMVTRPMRITDLQTVAQTTMAESGIILRVTRWYNANAKAEQLSIDTLYGLAELRDDHAVVVRTTEIS